MRPSSSAVTPQRAAFTCMATTSPVMPASRWSSVSPTQRMGRRPASKAARSRRLTVASVSPKYWRRSLWPNTTYSTPSSASMGAEISPVKAPEAAQWQFWAPTCRLVPAVRARAASRSVKGVQTTTWQPAPATRGLRASSSSRVWGRVLFIFQLPAITAGRRALFMGQGSFLWGDMAGRLWPPPVTVGRAGGPRRWGRV